MNRNSNCPPVWLSGQDSWSKGCGYESHCLERAVSLGTALYLDCLSQGTKWEAAWSEYMVCLLRYVYGYPILGNSTVRLQYYYPCITPEYNLPLKAVKLIMAPVISIVSWCHAWILEWRMIWSYALSCISSVWQNTIYGNLYLFLYRCPTKSAQDLQQP